MLSLIRELVIKDLKVRYSRLSLGFIWAFLSPFLMVLVFYLVFALIFKLKVEEAPFFLYLMSAIFPWNFFQHSVMGSVTSLAENKNIIRESNFPQYLIPVSVVLANFVSFLPALAVLMIISFITLKGVPLLILFLPLVLIIHLTITLGLAVLFSVIYVKWRDVRHILEITLFVLFYSTPIFYSLGLAKASLSPGLFQAYMYNPFVGVLNLYRAVLLKGAYEALQKYSGFFSLLFLPLIFAIGIVVVSVFVYKKNKNKINDYLSY